MRETRHHLAHLVDFAIAYIEDLIARFAGPFPRRTEVMTLEKVDVKEVALRNIKVGHDRVNQFVGTEVRSSNRNEAPLACTEYDRLLLLKNDGVFRVINIPEKLYVGPVKYLFRHDREQVFSMLYRHRKTGAHYAKRFAVDRFVVDREYSATPEGCIVVGLYTNHGVVLRLDLKPSKRRDADSVQVVFDEIEIRSATARGFKATAYPVTDVNVLDRGVSEAPAPEPEESGENAGTEPPETEAAPEPAETETSAPEAPPEPAGTEPPVPAPRPKRTRKPTAPAKEPKAAPAARDDARPQEPAPAEDQNDPRQLAAEWESRSGRAKLHPQPEPPPTPEPQPAPQPKPSVVRRKLIDEDTPFFLE